MRQRNGKQQPIYIDVSNDSTGGLSHSSMRGDMMQNLDAAIYTLQSCDDFQYVDKDDVAIAISAITRVRNQIKDFDNRVVYVKDREEYMRLTGVGG